MTDDQKRSRRLAPPGVSDAAVDLAAAQARVRFDPARVTVEALRQAVEAAGFEAG